MTNGVLPVSYTHLGFGAAVDGLHKAEHQADANVAALARRIWVGAAPAAKAAEAAAEQVAEQVAQVHAAAKATAEPDVYKRQGLPFSPDAIEGLTNPARTDKL